MADVTRLWCVMEVFCFLKMTGGDTSALERIVLIPITAGDDGGGGDGATVLALFTTFDAENATCYRVEDRQRLLGVIESGYGSLTEFNTAVRRSFSQHVVTGVVSSADGVSVE